MVGSSEIESGMSRLGFLSFFLVVFRFLVVFIRIEMVIVNAGRWTGPTGRRILWYSQWRSTRSCHWILPRYFPPVTRRLAFTTDPLRHFYEAWNEKEIFRKNKFNFIKPAFSLNIINPTQQSKVKPLTCHSHGANYHSKITKYPTVRYPRSKFDRSLKIK